MSDNEDFMMSDGEEDPFEYEESDDAEMAGSDNSFSEEDDDGEPNDGDHHVNYEEMYYSAKAYKDEDLQEALEQFQKIIDVIDENNGDVSWKFKSLKQSMKVQNSLNNYEGLINLYEVVIKYSDKLENKQYFIQSIEKIIDRYNKSLPLSQLKQLIELTLNNQAILNDKLLVKIYILKLNALVNDGTVDKAEVESISNLVISKVSNLNEYLRNQYLLEIYSIQLRIILFSDNYDIKLIKKIRNILQKSELLEKSIITHPRILGILRETKGKLLMLSYFDNDNAEITEVLMESFKNYDESGKNLDKLRILKYLLIHYLTNNNKSEINLLQSNEIKPYLNNKELKDEVIKKLLMLLRFYENNDIKNFLSIVEKESIFNKNYADYSFLNKFEEKIIKNFKIKVLKHFFKAFDNIKFEFLIRVFKIEDQSILEQLIFQMINSQQLPYEISFDYETKSLNIHHNNNVFAPLKTFSSVNFYQEITNNEKLFCQEFPNQKRIKDLTSESIDQWLTNYKNALPKFVPEKLTQNELISIENSNNLVNSNGEKNNNKFSQILMENLKKNLTELEISIKNKRENESINEEILEKLKKLNNLMFLDKKIIYLP